MNSLMPIRQIRWNQYVSRQKFPKLNQEQIEYISRLIPRNKIELIIKVLPKKEIRIILSNI